MIDSNCRSSAVKVAIKPRIPSIKKGLFLITNVEMQAGGVVDHRIGILLDQIPVEHGQNSAQFILPMDGVVCGLIVRQNRSDDLNSRPGVTFGEDSLL